ncbi:MAG: EAL domain-containing protein [Duganella sp.]
MDILVHHAYGDPHRTHVEWLSFALLAGVSLLVIGYFFLGGHAWTRTAELDHLLHLACVVFCAWLLVALLGALVLVTVQRHRRALHRSSRAQQRDQEQHATRIALALAGADLGLWDWHLPSGRRSVDQRGADMLGYAPGDIDRIPEFYHHVHPDDVAAVHAALTRHLRGEADNYRAEFRMRHRVAGWIWVHSCGRVVERDDAGQPVRVVGTRMDITERKLAEAKIHHLAYYDGLTSLPNRRLLLERLAPALEHSARSQRHGAVLFIDLDHFKHLNDTLGHDMGDRLLQSVARRLTDVTRGGDTVARLGGDEFVIVLEQLAGDREAAVRAVETLGAAIVRRLGQPHVLEGRTVHVTPSIGATVFDGATATVEQLLKQADLAMYDAKASGRDTLRFYDPAMQQRVSARADLAEALRHALPRGQLALHYQPIVDAAGMTCSMEALLRWNHPQRGSVPPDVFIALAEQSGLILALGQWVLEQACAQLARWGRCAASAGWTVAVNVSARQFRQPGFVPDVLAVLAAHGVAPGRLKLELTESMLLDDLDDVAAKMDALRQHGIGFALDDFGTGYCSLGYLKRLPLCQLKIDRSFVQDVLSNAHDAAIVRAILALAHSLGLDVVAEGVETAAQQGFLVACGCRYFQGYLFGRPAPARAELAAAADVADRADAADMADSGAGRPVSTWRPA